jgi:ABC-type glycerol-3-phosphate transport system permease component
MGNRYTWRTSIIEILAILLGLVFLVPFYYVFSNSLKPFAEILTNTSALPKVLMFDNYINVYASSNQKENQQYHFYDIRGCDDHSIPISHDSAY